MKCEGREEKIMISSSCSSLPTCNKSMKVEGRMVLVAVKASSKDISNNALLWALTSIVQPHDFLSLLLVLPPPPSGKSLWSFPRFGGDCASGSGDLEQKSELTDSYYNMILQLHHIYDLTKVKLEIKTVYAGGVAAEAKRGSQASWVVLDKQLKHEEKCCMHELHCNIVVVNRSHAKVLRLNLTTTTTTTIICPSKQNDEDKDEDTVDENSTTTSSHSSSSSSSSSGSDSSTTHPLYMIKNEYENTKDNMVSLSRGVGYMHPPLCSKCRNKSPSFGKPPRWFTYGELEKATIGFSEANFLAEGGFGCVHRGVLDDGQNVAVKQHKVASSQGDVEFCSEVEVLSCAQHRNVVMLIGYCIQGGRRLLVYEYICNGSLDSHLWGGRKEGLEWSSRQKIAVGAARGLRYLHEECRVGCIVHRDMRPNNILITHDFQPLVGDFGLARWQPDGDKGVDTRVIGTFGYLAPEYAQSGQVTEKADVYSFGVVLLELMSGRKAVDLNRPKGQQCLSEWARPLLEEYEEMYKVMEPMVMDCGSYSENEACAMLQAASMCIRRDPLSRPRMSQVLRILEGHVTPYLPHDII